jgi:translation initiation factor IF-1
VAVAAAVVVVVVAIATNSAVRFRSGPGRTGPRFFLGRHPFWPVCEVLPVPGDPAVGQADYEMKEEHIEVEGRVQTVLPGTMFRVELDNKHLVLATICGKMRKRWVRLTVGDRVKMEMSPYDLDKARIVWRLR